MKKQRYIVEIEMPDGDFISAGWLKYLIQADCDAEEDEGRNKVTVQETSLPSDLDEAAEEVRSRVKEIFDSLPKYDIDEERHNRVEFSLIALEAFALLFYQAGAEWMAGQGETQEDILYGDADGHSIIRLKYSLRHLSSQFKPGDKVIVQIRKK